MHSTVLVIAQEHRAASDALGAVMGWGTSNYMIALAADMGEEFPTATHFAARVDVTPAFITQLTAMAGSGLPPADWDAFGTSTEAVAAALAGLHADFDPMPMLSEPKRFTRPYDHVLDVFGRLNLVRIS